MSEISHPLHPKIKLDHTQKIKGTVSFPGACCFVCFFFFFGHYVCITVAVVCITVAVVCITVAVVCVCTYANVCTAQQGSGNVGNNGRLNIYIYAVA